MVIHPIILDRKHYPKYIKRATEEELKEFLNDSTNKNIIIFLNKNFRKLLHRTGYRFLKNTSTLRLLSSFWRILLWFFILPVSLIDLIIGKCARFNLFYLNPLDSELSESINHKIKQFLSIHRNRSYSNKNGHSENESDKCDFFRIIFHYYYEKYPVHKTKLDNYVALYGFTRALSLTFCLLGMIFTFGGILEILSFKYWLILIFLYFNAYLFYAAFMKFYRRYTLEGLMCLEIDNDLVESKNKMIK